MRNVSSSSLHQSSVRKESYLFKTIRVTEALKKQIIFFSFLYFKSMRSIPEKVTDLEYELSAQKG